MHDNGFRCAPARGTSCVIECNGQDATRHAAPRRGRDFPIDGCRSVTRHSAPRNRPYSCAASRADRAVDCFRGGTAGVEAHPYWSLHSRPAASVTHRRGHDMTRDMYGYPEASVPSAVARRGAHYMQECTGKSCYRHPQQYLTQYLSAYLGAYCARRLTTYRWPSAPCYGYRCFAADLERGTAQHAVSGTAPDSYATRARSNLRYGANKPYSRCLRDYVRCGTHQPRTGRAYSASRDTARHADTRKGAALGPHTESSWAPCKAGNSCRYLDDGAQPDPGHGGAARIGRSVARSSHGWLRGN